MKSNIKYKIQKTQLLHNTYFSYLKLKTYLKPISQKYPNTNPILLYFLKLLNFNFK